MSAREAKYGFGKLIDLARTAPVTVAKHGRPVVVVIAVEEFDRLKKGLEQNYEDLTALKKSEVSES